MIAKDNTPKNKSKTYNGDRTIRACATRAEIPRRAREEFVENQLELVNASIMPGVKEYEKLSHELRRLTGQSPQVPPEVARVIESTIVSRRVERSRLQKRSYVVALSRVPQLRRPSCTVILRTPGQGHRETVAAGFGEIWFDGRSPQGV